jgi:hypothetical protein
MFFIDLIDINNDDPYFFDEKIMMIHDRPYVGLVH